MSDTTVTVVGNIARPPEARVTPKGSRVVTIAVASHRGVRTADGWSQTEASYFDVELWDAMANNAIVSLHKGMSVLVYGHIRTQSWTDSEGKKRFKQKLIAKAIGPNLRWQQATVERVTENQRFAEEESQWEETQDTNVNEAEETAELPTGTFDTSAAEVPIPA